MKEQFHVGVTGNRVGMTHEQRLWFEDYLDDLRRLDVDVVVHLGDCVGCDADAYAVAQLFNRYTVGHVPINPRLRSFSLYDEERAPKEYLERNHDIVDESDVLVAFPRSANEELRSGTWATVRYARKQNVKTLVVHPDGYEIAGQR